MIKTWKTEGFELLVSVDSDDSPASEGFLLSARWPEAIQEFPELSSLLPVLQQELLEMDIHSPDDFKKPGISRIVAVLIQRRINLLIEYLKGEKITNE